MRVSYQGEPGAYGEQAVICLFGGDVQAVPCRLLPEVFDLVATQDAAAGVVPVENSQAGSINQSYDLLRQHRLHVQGELLLPVDHCLLALPGQHLDAVTTVYSHAQALAQCDAYILERGLEAIATHDTAGSARMLQERGLVGAGAIASARAAEIYGLEILARGIQTIKDNHTRFLLLGRDAAPRQPGPQRTSLVIATEHRPGALYRCLGALAARGLNLLKLESRPSRTRPWEYVFYLDFEGHCDDDAVRDALADLAGLTTSCRVLGSYPWAGPAG